MNVVVFGSGGDIGRAVFNHLTLSGMSVQGFTHAGCDVTKADDVRRAIDAAWSKHGGLDGAVIAHGAPGCIKPTLELTDEEFERVIQVDLVGTMRVCREVARYMIAQGHGSIVIVSSMHAIATYPNRAAYAAAKAGVVGLMRALAVEWAKHCVSVNAILPGQVYGTRRTMSMQGVTDEYTLIDRVRQRSPSSVLACPNDVAYAAEYLLKSSGTNGHSLVVDEGWTASAWYGDHAQP